VPYLSDLGGKKKRLKRMIENSRGPGEKTNWGGDCCHPSAAKKGKKRLRTFLDPRALGGKKGRVSISKKKQTRRSLFGDFAENKTVRDQDNPSGFWVWDQLPLGNNGAQATVGSRQEKHFERPKKISKEESRGKMIPQLSIGRKHPGGYSYADRAGKENRVREARI